MIKPINRVQNTSFKSKFLIPDVADQDQQTEIFDALCQKAANMQQAKAIKTEDGKGVIFDIHNRHNDSFTKALTDLGITNFEILA